MSSWPATLSPTHPPGPEGQKQLAASLAALEAMAPHLPALPWEVAVDGSGMSYPTSMVNLSVAYAAAAAENPAPPPVSWTANSADIAGGDVAARLTSTEVTGNAEAEAQLAAAQAAVTTLVDSDSIGNRSIPYHARATGDDNAPTAVVNVRVHRAVKGYDT